VAVGFPVVAVYCHKNYGLIPGNFGVWAVVAVVAVGAKEDTATSRPYLFISLSRSG